MILLLCDLCGEKAVDWDQAAIDSEKTNGNVVSIESMCITRTTWDPGGPDFLWTVHPGHLCLKCLIALLSEHLIEEAARDELPKENLR